MVESVGLLNRCTGQTVPQVRILSSPLQNPGFPRVFRISGQLLWSSVAPMQLGAWRLRRCISRRAPKIESFFESRESPKHWGFACPGLVPIQRTDRETLKKRVRSGELKLLLGTDAASEGLNLQRLGTLINIDLPWNPTRLEQRKGRIQRIGQVRDEVWIVVPLFQRPYVWNEENQWEPLWKDMARMAEKLVLHPGIKHYPHFLGAVVLQQVQNASGTMQERVIIDGQQRLTTLQLLFDALHAQLVACNAEAAALRMETLVVNAAPFCRKPEDRFKVWPTNRDRPAFNEVMAADIPTDYSTLKNKHERANGSSPPLLLYTCCRMAYI